MIAPVWVTPDSTTPVAAVMFVGLATLVGKVTPAAAVTVWPASWSAFAVTRAVTAAAVGVAAVAAVVTLVFIVAVRSPLVGALVRLVTVVIVPAVIFVGVARSPSTK